MKNVDLNQSPLYHKEQLTEVDLTNELVGLRMRTTKRLDLRKIPKNLREKYQKKL